MRVRSSFVVAALLAAAPALRAQAAQPPLASCSYAECALRVEPGRLFFGSPELLRGAAGQRVARFGVRGPDLQRIVAGSDSAVAHARTFRPHQRRAGLAALVGSLAGAAAVVVGINDGNDGAVLALSVGAAALGAYAGYEARLAARELSRSLWWYNGALPR
jgi:hypothetical protein